MTVFPRKPPVADTREIQGAFGTVQRRGGGPGWRQRLRTLLAIVGPGLIVMVGDNDAGAFATYTQAGQNYGRTFSATMNFGSVRIAAEPLETNRQRDIAVTDIRIEKPVSFGRNVKIGPFLDFYNIFNQNPEQNITWASGSSFLRPTAIVRPAWRASAPK